jgi:hypothetical protein
VFRRALRATPVKIEATGGLMNYHEILAARIWLPFERNLMIEEPNWDGKVDRNGSVFRLVDEINAIRAAVAETDSSVVQSIETDAALERIHAAAWQTSSVILHLARLAAAKHLPLLTTG